MARRRRPAPGDRGCRRRRAQAPLSLSNTGRARRALGGWRADDFVANHSSAETPGEASSVGKDSFMSEAAQIARALAREMRSCRAVAPSPGAIATTRCSASRASSRVVSMLLLVRGGSETSAERDASSLGIAEEPVLADVGPIQWPASILPTALRAAEAERPRLRHLSRVTGRSAGCRRPTAGHLRSRRQCDGTTPANARPAGRRREPRPAADKP